MLVRKQRLTQDRDFKLVLRRGRAFFSPAFRLKCLANQLPLSRFGLIVSSKISKKATVRNRLKRQIRAIIRLDLKKIKPGYDLVISVKQPALKFTYQQLAEELVRGLKQLKLWSE